MPVIVFTWCSCRMFHVILNIPHFSVHYVDCDVGTCSFTAQWSTWPGNHLVPCVAELVGSCIPIHAHRCLRYPFGLSLCLSVDHFCLVPVDDMVLFHGMVCDGWLVSYTALPCPGGLGLCTSCKRVHFFLVFLDPQTELPACLSNIWTGAVLARDMIDQFGLLFILDLVLQMNHKLL